MNLRKRSGRYLRDKLGITALQVELSNQINVLSTYMNLMLPESKELESEVMKYSRAEIKKRYGITGFNASIHKNDLMFYHHLRKRPDRAHEVVFHYFNVGLDSLKKIHEIIRGPEKQARILDFGAGYGRGSRFIPYFFPNAEVMVSEVKEQAMVFQEEQFGFHTIHHSEDPASFGSAQYDLIVAISVFSHLPRDLGSAWLEKLYACLRPDGSFVFTFNNTSRGPDPRRGYFFIHQSEDQGIRWVGDRIDRSEVYGSAFYSDQEMTKMIKQATGIMPEIIHGFSGTQDAVVLKK